MKILRGLAFFINTLLLYLGLPLLGWGIDDLAGFLSYGPRVGYAAVVLALAAGTGYQAVDAPEGIRGSKGRKGTRIGRQSVVRIVVILLLLIALAALPFADRRGYGVLAPATAVQWGGVGLFAVGCGLVFWSGLALGRMYSQDVTIQEDHRLVTSGPYRRIRHPRYLGGILLSFGLALVFRSWLGLLLGLVYIGVILFRIRDEERLMHQTFGTAWEAYRARSWRLVPFVY